MKKFLSILILSVVLLSSCAVKKTPPNAPDDTDKNNKPPVEVSYKASDFFPLEKDVHMVYKGTGNEYAPFETYVDFVKDKVVQLRNINDGTTLAIVYMLDESGLKKVFSRGETYFRYDFTSMNSGEELLIKEPVEVGNSWSLEDGAKRSITGIDVAVTTPLKEFKALEVTTEWQDSTVKDYYVKDIGLVKSVFTDKPSGSIITREVEKIEKGTPFSHEAFIFFPDFDNNRTVFVNRKIEILTNQDMKYKFQKELKTPPEGSSLIAPLTKDVQILSIAYDEGNNAVTVDFSSDLVKDMNAGSGLESLIVQSIVNTIGGYYQVENVAITLEKKPYSSGHMYLAPGEYFKVDRENFIEYK